MQRAIVGYHLDQESHWVAQLSCGHGQHVRHQPPFTVREWVVTPEGRSHHLGQLLECVLCDRQQLPSGFVAYRKTPVFTADKIPRGILSKHSTKAGVWARLEVLSGTIAYVIEATEARQVLAAGESVMIVPELEHRVDVLGPVEICVEFYRAAQSDAAAL